MFTRELTALKWKQAGTLILWALLLAAFPPVEADAASGDARYLTLGQVEQFVVQGEIEWHITGEPDGEKRIEPVGRILNDCLNSGGSGASMELRNHPTEANHKVLYISLSPACQTEGPGLETVQANTDVLPDSDADRRANSSNLSSHAAFRSALRLDAEFSGKISVCALRQGDASSRAWESRTSGLCDNITGRLQDGGRGLVQGGIVMGKSEIERRAAAAAAAEAERAARLAEQQERDIVAEILTRAGRAGCEDPNRGAMILAQLAGSGINYRGLQDAMLSTSLDGMENNIAKADDLDELEEIEEALNAVPERANTEERIAELKGKLADRYLELAEAQIRDIESFDESGAAKARRIIADAKKTVRRLLGTSEYRDRRGSIANLAKIAAKAAADGNDFDTAIEFAQLGRELDNPAPETTLRYMVAERRFMEKAFEECIEDADDSTRKLEKCYDNREEIEDKSEKAIRYAKKNDLEDEQEELEEQHNELFGETGVIQTPFGPQFSPSMGTLDELAIEAMRNAMYGSMYGGNSSIAMLMMQMQMGMGGRNFRSPGYGMQMGPQFGPQFGRSPAMFPGFGQQGGFPRFN